MPTEPAQPVIAEEVATLRRPGRALIGWMSEEHGARVLAGGNQEGAERPDLREQVLAARSRVATRPLDLVDQTAIFDDSHPAIPDIMARLQAQENTVPFWAEGWVVAVVDLTRICSLQQSIMSQQALERVVTIDPEDMLSIASVTLPPPATTQLPVQFDEIHRTWIISAANPNLKIAGQFAAPLQPGYSGFGFAVAVMPSFLQVARHHDRWVLRDGYHRAYGLLERGITRAPAFVKDFGVGSLGIGEGLFSTDIYLSERPPFLKDFLDDEVAADVEVPAVQKMIVVHGLELNPLA